MCCLIKKRKIFHSRNVFTNDLVIYQKFPFKKLDNVTQVEVVLKKKATVKDITGFTVYCKNMILFWLENKTGKMAFGKKSLKNSLVSC